VLLLDMVKPHCR